jgi:DNA-binding transcriptional ArsR family regulator
MKTRNETDVAREQSGADLNDVFEALAHPYRRSVLRILDRESPRCFDVIAERLVDVRDPPSADRVQVALVHEHLPRLADAGLVVYDDRARECELDEASTALALLETAHHKR